MAGALVDWDANVFVKKMCKKACFTTRSPEDREVIIGDSIMSPSCSVF